MRFLVSYDLRFAATYDDYTSIAAAIAQLGGVQILISAWSLHSEWSAAQLSEHLRTFMHEDDRLLVAECQGCVGFNLMADVNRLR